MYYYDFKKTTQLFALLPIQTTQQTKVIFGLTSLVDSERSANVGCNNAAHLQTEIKHINAQRYIPGKHVVPLPT